MFALWASPDAAKSFHLLFLALQVKTHLLVLGLSCVYFFSSFQTERDCEKGVHIQMKLTNDPLCTFVDNWDFNFSLFFIFISVCTNFFIFAFGFSNHSMERAISVRCIALLGIQISIFHFLYFFIFFFIWIYIYMFTFVLEFSHQCAAWCFSVIGISMFLLFCTFISVCLNFHFCVWIFLERTISAVPYFVGISIFHFFVFLLIFVFLSIFLARNQCIASSDFHLTVPTFCIV